jgi:hypothetical protein
LGWSGAEQNWDCDPGVYLAGHPSLSIFVMLQHYVEQGDPDSVPKNELADMCVIVIDDSRVTASKLGPDPEIDRPDVWLYEGVIDVTNMPVLDVDQAMLMPDPDA